MSSTADRSVEFPTVDPAMLVDENYGMWDTTIVLKFLREFENFHVTDAARERHLQETVKLLESVWDEDGDGIFVTLRYNPDLDEDDLMDDDEIREPLLKRLLQLGIDPNLMSEGLGSLSHRISECGRVQGAELIGACRPDLSSKDQDGRTPEEVALHFASQEQVIEDKKPFIKVAAFWRKLAKHGFPSVAQLAHDKRWFAVHNLVRRGLVTDREAREDYRGKTAIEWAKFHGRQDLKVELAYFLQVRPQETPATEELKEVVVAGVTKLAEENEELKVKVASLEAELVQQEKKFEDSEQDWKNQRDELQRRLEFSQRHVEFLSKQLLVPTSSSGRKRGKPNSF